VIEYPKRTLKGGDMSVKYTYIFTVPNLKTFEKILSLINAWSAIQDRTDWKAYGCCPKTYEDQKNTYCFFILTKSGLPSGLGLEVLDILKKAGAVFVSTLIDPHHTDT
jgi:hypothetical protein